MKKIFILLFTIACLGFILYSANTTSATGNGVPPVDCSFDNANSGALFAQGYDPCPGNLTCMTYTCGAGSNNPYLCCPRGAPYLNHCDCRCYQSSNFNCGSYSYCK